MSISPGLILEILLYSEDAQNTFSTILQSDIYHPPSIKVARQTSEIMLNEQITFSKRRLNDETIRKDLKY